MDLNKFEKEALLNLVQTKVDVLGIRLTEIKQGGKQTEQYLREYYESDIGFWKGIKEKVDSEEASQVCTVPNST